MDDAAKLLSERTFQSYNTINIHPLEDVPCPDMTGKWRSPHPSFKADFASITALRDLFISMFNIDIERASVDTVTNVFEQRLDEAFKKWLLLSSFDLWSTTFTTKDVFPKRLDTLIVSIAASLRDQQGERIEGENTIDSIVTIGNERDIQTRVHVKWAWLLFPLLLQISVMALLLVTIILTRRRHMPIWKTSTVATLVHGVDVADIPELAKTEKTSSMDELAGSQQFQLRVTGKGYRLVRCSVDEGCAARNGL